ncbi:hypothetical protein ACFE04_004469 [Oxalis oulophora]
MAGGVHLEKLKNPETKNCGSGCVISHVLGTVCKLFAGIESVKATSLSGQSKDPSLVCLVKLFSWKKQKSVLGISYMLFMKLVGDDNKEISKGYAYETIKTLLLDTPDLFIFDEGHTPRNDKSRMFKALFQIKTEKRVILFRHSFLEQCQGAIYTLFLVRSAENGRAWKLSKEEQNTLSRMIDLRLKPEAGDKSRFLMELIRLSTTVKEKVLVFGQYIEALTCIKEQLESKHYWKEWKEIIYMDGNSNSRKRQTCINIFNNPKAMLG